MGKPNEQALQHERLGAQGLRVVEAQEDVRDRFRNRSLTLRSPRCQPGERTLSSWPNEG